MWVVVYGSIFEGEGLQGIVGPFDTYDEAEEYMERKNLGHYEKAVYEVFVPETTLIKKEGSDLSEEI